LKKLLALFIVILFSSACQDNNVSLGSKLIEVELIGDLAERTLEASGLTWYKDNLIILPQFPHKWDDLFDGAIYFIPKKRIENYINGENSNPIKGEKIQFIADGLDEIGKSSGSGYEAITFVGDNVYVSIESISDAIGSSYIVKGKIDFENRKLVLDASTKFEIKSQTGINNMGEETIFQFNSYIYAIHEANGLNVNKNPYATKLDEKLMTSEKIPIPNIDLRLTDATDVDSTGKFYVINYYYPGEFNKLKPNLEKDSKAIEQILELQITDNKIVQIDKSIIELTNIKEENGHNWEGIVRFNNGFLLVTDMFPKTILAYYK